MALTPEELGRRAAAINARKAEEAALKRQQDALREEERQRDRALRRQKHAEVCEYLRTFVGYLASIGAEPLPVLLEADKDKRYVPHGEAYHLEVRNNSLYNELEGLYVSTDLQGYVGLPERRVLQRFTANTPGVEHIGYITTSEAGLGDLSGWRDTIDRNVTEAVAAYERGDFPPPVNIDVSTWGYRVRSYHPLHGYSY